MSELKAYYGDVYIPVYGSIADAQVYLKSEADKVIARHKYKRCLAMANWCESENYTACWYHENSERCEWTEKWEKRWLELAEKFKEAK